MLILGLNAYHVDSSACLLQDGKLVAAAEEERFRRIKHWAGFPAEAIKYCLSELRATLSDIDHVAVNQDSQANLWKKIGYTIARRPDIGLLVQRVRNRGARSSLIEELNALGLGRYTGELETVEHHMAHLSSAFHVSPFTEAAVASVDGFGDFASAAWGYGREAAIDVQDRVYFPHSLGIFYQTLTQWLGFPNYGDEYKVMGLAPYGEPKYRSEMRRLVQPQDDGSYRLDLKFFRHQKEMLNWEAGEPKVGPLYSDALVDLLGPARKKEDELTQRHRDVARSVQAMYEEAFFNLLHALHAKNGGENLALAGGCAMNSVANGKVLRNTPYKRVYVQSAAGDAGGAIGAAFALWHRLGGSRGSVMDHAYWGPEFDNQAIEQLLRERREPLASGACSVERIDSEQELCAQTARAIADGQVVGWFQGRMEWGPRALGNRSILGDPRRADMKDILNLKIKRRESFRPFAPSILREAVPEWFETDDDVPFMMQVYPIRHDKRASIPAVTHVDGSGRLQTVYAHTNPRYYRLIETFAALTGVPLVLNTSFNENEPVVCRPEEALDCFLRTRMDVLVMGNWMVRRHSESP